MRLFTGLHEEMSDFSYYHEADPYLCQTWKQIIIQEFGIELTRTRACHEHFLQQTRWVIAV